MADASAHSAISFKNLYLRGVDGSGQGKQSRNKGKGKTEMGKKGGEVKGKVRGTR